MVDNSNRELFDVSRFLIVELQSGVSEGLNTSFSFVLLDLSNSQLSRTRLNEPCKSCAANQGNPELSNSTGSPPRLRSYTLQISHHGGHH